MGVNDLDPAERELMLTCFEDKDELCLLEFNEGTFVRTRMGEKFFEGQEYVDAFHGLEELELITHSSGVVWRLTRKGRRFAQELALQPSAEPPAQQKSVGRPNEAKRFQVALSFPGERRDYVSKVAQALCTTFGRETIFYDKHFEAELARPDLDTYLQEIYHDDSELIVVFLCAEYDKKEWCGLEWRAIRDLIKKRKSSDIMPIRFDDTHIQGLFSIDGYIDAAGRQPEEIASLIIQRYRKNKEDPRAGPSLLGVADQPTTVRSGVALDPERVSLGKLPPTDPNVLGRQEQLEKLDSAWTNDQIHVISVVALAGEGKTALVNAWLNGMDKDRYRGAERVYGWSFYSQGAAEGRQVSADPFIASALSWFGDPDPATGSPWDKGLRLAQLVTRHRTLLVIDGLEPLQNPPGERKGYIRDPSLQSLLRELARHNPGLCVITTRLAVTDIQHRVGTSVDAINLGRMSRDAGAVYLTTLGVHGSKQDLEQAVDEFDGHALALTLMGTYLRVVYHGDVRQRDKIDRLTDERRQGAHARRVMASYEQWFDRKSALNILRLMGLFDRPAEARAIRALREPPVIAGLTSDLEHISEADWQYALYDLRDLGLLAKENPFSPDALDCHPLVREYFGERLKTLHPVAWEEAHSRLYEHFKGIPDKEQPETLQEMMPLYQAVAHGCQAARHQEAFDEVYWPRIQRGKDFFSTWKLGAFGADLSVLRGFVDRPWSLPVSGLSRRTERLVLREAGYHLRALGELDDAIEPMQAALAIAIEDPDPDWEDATVSASHLRGLYLVRGEIAMALHYAEESVDYADLSGDSFLMMCQRMASAHAFHQAGCPAEAEARFCKADKMQQELQQTEALPYSYQVRWHCDFLLDQGKYQEVVDRASAMLTRPKEQESPLEIGLHHMSIGRAQLLVALEQDSGNFSQAQKHLDEALDGLRKAGRQDRLILGLLARAELHRIRRDFAIAGRDIEDAFEVASRSRMRLYECDGHLECCRLILAMVEANAVFDTKMMSPDSPLGLYGAANEPLRAARRHLEMAKAMEQDMDYHRRHPEVLLETAHLELLEGNKEEARKSLAAAKDRIDETGCHRWDRDAAELEARLG